jgi:hypothetical protein
MDSLELYNRLDVIRLRREAGDTLEKIGTLVGLTRERVRQICLANRIVAPERPAPEPSVCANCGGAYESVRGRRGTTLEGSHEHLVRTGHHVSRGRSSKPWIPNARQQAIIDGFNLGHTVREIAITSGASGAVVNQVIKRAGLGGSYKAERDIKIIEAWLSGETYTTLMGKFNLSYPRVRLIVAAYISTGAVAIARRRGRGK